MASDLVLTITDLLFLNSEYIKHCHGKGIDPVYQTFEIATDEEGNTIRRKVLISSFVQAGTSTVNPLTGLIVLEVNTMPSGTFAGAVDIL